MIALDTNVLVRLLVQDDELQYRRANRLIQSSVERHDPLFVSDIVLCETVWTLTSRYRVGRGDLAGIVERLLWVEGLDFEDRGRIEKTLSRFRSSRGDFADFLILRALLKEDGFFSP